MDTSHSAGPWLQTVVCWNDPRHAERVWANLLGPRMNHEVEKGTLTGWFLIRKSPSWLIRYAPAEPIPPEVARSAVGDIFARAAIADHVSDVTECIYEPETVAFGGDAAMETVHRLFAEDTHHFTRYLALLTAPGAVDRRRELSLLLNTALMRAAQQEWFECGDIWALVAAMRGSNNHLPDVADATALTVRQFITADPNTALSRLNESEADLVDSWLASYRLAGARLRELGSKGALLRGLRAVLAHIVLFSWNRIGLRLTDQRRLAAAARDAVFSLHAASLTLPHVPQQRSSQ
ncbi:thiopeptide-type bacteriocin biosynthesis protein [Natronoglycomyces albus]|nr:thiopeptide-type bacteriocin biosynthesis protein [Natronoglycomyces albus]